MTDSGTATEIQEEIQEEIIEETEASVGGDSKIVIHNDDVTPMDFVMAVLREIFKRPVIIAEAIMWEAHENGNAVVMSAAKDEAERLVRMAHFLSRSNGFPLKFTIE